MAGMQSGLVGGPSKISASRALISVMVASNPWGRVAPAGGRTVTVAVMPATSGTPAGTLSIAIRTGTRCAKRTQVYTGSTLGRPCVLGDAFDTLMPRVIVET